MESKISHYGSIAGSVMAILTVIGFIGKPHLTEFIDAEIQAYDLIQQEKSSNKVKLRHLLSGKMGVADDEVHIKLGEQYKNEKVLINRVDSLHVEIIRLKQKNIRLIEDINDNYSDILKLRRNKKDK